MRRVLPFVILALLINANIVSADNVFLNPLTNGKFIPRKAMFANAPGSYELAVRALKPTVEPGGMINLEVFITGYGEIRGAKVYFLPPSKFVEVGENSKAIYGLISKPIPGNLNEFEFGGSEKQIDEHGFIVEISGLGTNKTDATSFIDIKFADNTYYPRPTSMILTENRWKSAPIALNIKTRKDVGSGIHKLRLYLTYFNGKEWKSSVVSTDVEILTRLKRNENLVWIFGLFLTLLAIIPGWINVRNIYATRNDREKEKEKVKDNRKNFSKVGK